MIFSEDPDEQGGFEKFPPLRELVTGALTEPDATLDRCLSFAHEPRDTRDSLDLARSLIAFSLVMPDGDRQNRLIEIFTTIMQRVDDWKDEIKQEFADHARMSCMRAHQYGASHHAISCAPRALRVMSAMIDRHIEICRTEIIPFPHGGRVEAQMGETGELKPKRDYDARFWRPGDSDVEILPFAQQKTAHGLPRAAL